MLDKNDKALKDFLNYVNKGSIAGVETVLNEGLDIDARLNGIGSALLISVRHGYTDMVEYLVERGANPNLTDRNGKTPLYLAVADARRQIVRYLLERGADANQQEVDHYTPLHRAVLNNDFICVKELMRYGADEELVDKWGRTAAGIAKEKDNEKIYVYIKSYKSMLEQQALDQLIGNNNPDTALNF